MNRFATAFCVLALLGGVAVAQDTGTTEKPAVEGEGEKAEEQGIQFLHDLEEARKLAVETEKHLFIYFYTPT